MICDEEEQGIGEWPTGAQSAEEPNPPRPAYSN
jgi:hypothetical protein